MKNVAAMSGHTVRRTDFFLGSSATDCCRIWVGALAVANFYVFLRGRPSLSKHAPGASSLTKNTAYPGFYKNYFHESRAKFDSGLGRALVLPTQVSFQSSARGSSGFSLANSRSRSLVSSSRGVGTMTFTSTI